jgi:hypothetical protein
LAKKLEPTLKKIASELKKALAEIKKLSAKKGKRSHVFARNSDPAHETKEAAQFVAELYKAVRFAHFVSSGKLPLTLWVLSRSSLFSTTLPSLSTVCPLLALSLSLSLRKSAVSFKS